MFGLSRWRESVRDPRSCAALTRPPGSWACRLRVIRDHATPRDQTGPHARRTLPRAGLRVRAIAACAPLAPPPAFSYNIPAWHRSSVVERAVHNRHVAGPNPAGATRPCPHLLTCRPPLLLEQTRYQICVGFSSHVHAISSGQCAYYATIYVAASIGFGPDSPP